MSSASKLRFDNDALGLRLASGMLFGNPSASRIGRRSGKAVEKIAREWEKMR